MSGTENYAGMSSGGSVVVDVDVVLGASPVEASMVPRVSVIGKDANERGDGFGEDFRAGMKAGRGRFEGLSAGCSTKAFQPRNERTTNDQNGHKIDKTPHLG